MRNVRARRTGPRRTRHSRRRHARRRRSRCHRRRGSRRRRGLAGRWLRSRARLHDRQERERIDVALLVASSADAEMDVGHRQLVVARRTNRADDLPFRDGLSTPNRVRAQVHERDRVPVRRLDRDGLALVRDSSGEGDRPRGRRGDLDPRWRSDVDATVLPGVVRMALVEREKRQHRPVDGPAPAERRRRNDERGNRSQCDEQTHLAV